MRKQNKEIDECTYCKFWEYLVIKYEPEKNIKDTLHYCNYPEGPNEHTCTGGSTCAHYEVRE